jgi:DNA-binding MarR family transcriptional regulator
VNLSERKPNIGVLLRVPSQQLILKLHRRLAEAGYPDIRPAHGYIFQHIQPEGSRLTDLAERAQLTKQSISYLVDYLEARGYLERGPDPTDGRSKLVRLTEAGRELMNVADRIFAQMEEEMSAKMGSEDLQTLRHLLGTLFHTVSSIG